MANSDVTKEPVPSLEAVKESLPVELGDQRRALEAHMQAWLLERQQHDVEVARLEGELAKRPGTGECYCDTLGETPCAYCQVSQLTAKNVEMAAALRSKLPQQWYLHRADGLRECSECGRLGEEGQVEHTADCPIAALSGEGKVWEQVEKALEMCDGALKASEKLNGELGCPEAYLITLTLKRTEAQKIPAALAAMKGE